MKPVNTIASDFRPPYVSLRYRKIRLAPTQWCYFGVSRYLTSDEVKRCGITSANPFIMYMMLSMAWRYDTSYRGFLLLLPGSNEIEGRATVLLLKTLKNVTNVRALRNCQLSVESPFENIAAHPFENVRPWSEQFKLGFRQKANWWKRKKLRFARRLLRLYSVFINLVFWKLQ